jgi:hypothetical protein
MATATTKRTKGRRAIGATKSRRAQTGPCPEVVEVPLTDVRPAVVNDAVYGVIRPDDPALDKLVRKNTVGVS